MQIRFLVMVTCLSIALNMVSANDVESSVGITTESTRDKTQATPNHDPVSLSFYNNQTVTVPLSLADANRLYIDNDHIKDIGCMRGFCVSKEFDTGDAIIKLGEAAQFAKGGFTVFVSTQKGRKLALQVLPKAIPGQVIALQALSGVSETTIQKDKQNSPYQEHLIELIKAMINHHQGHHPHLINDHSVLSDYGVVEITNTSAERLNSAITILPYRLFQGERFMGVVYRVKNASHHQVPLTGAQFYKSGMLALALSTESLAPQETAFVYQIQKGIT